MLSIVIPTYNEEALLPRVLRSLKRQTFKDFEVIVADARSTDRTREIAAAAGCRIVDGGLPGRGRNLGAAAAKGGTILFFDADIELTDERFIEDFLAAFTARGLDVATCPLEAIDGGLRDTVFHGVYNGYIRATEKFVPHAHGLCILVKRDMHVAVGGFDEDIKLAEDHDYAQRVSRIGGRFGIVRDLHVPVSTRRLRRDGYLSIAARFVLCELHMLTLGPVKSDIFRYRFGYSKEVVNSERT